MLRWWSKAVKLSCFLLLAACRTPCNPWDMRVPLCVGGMCDRTMFSPVCALPSPASAGSCPPLFGRFTGTTAQSDFSSACVSVVRLCAFTDRPSSITEGALEISRFSCMLFLSVRGFLDYAGPDSHSRLTRLPCCLPPTRQGVGILIWRFSKLNHPAHRCLGLRFATHLAMCHARLEVRMESLSPFL